MDSNNQCNFSDYTCDCCEYHSDNASNVRRHMKNLHPDHEVVQEKCDACTRLMCLFQLENHKLVCDGVSPLQCPGCMKMFSSHQSKSNHKKTCKGIVTPLPVLHSLNKIIRCYCHSQVSIPLPCLRGPCQGNVS